MIISLTSPDIYFCDIEFSPSIKLYIENSMIGESVFVTCILQLPFQQRKNF